MNQILKHVKALDLSVSLLAAASCLLTLVQIPAWSLFIGWAWYYTMGGKLHVFKQATPAMLAGSFLAFAFFLVQPGLAVVVPDIVATMICVFVTVFLLMMVLKIPAFAYSLPAFNGYSCVFVGYAAGTYLPIPGVPDMLCAFIWITGANFLGLVFGWVSLEVEKKFQASLKME
jgi:hypothetical protein